MGGLLTEHLHKMTSSGARPLSQQFHVIITPNFLHTVGDKGNKLIIIVVSHFLYTQLETRAQAVPKWEDCSAQSQSVSTR